MPQSSKKQATGVEPFFNCDNEKFITTSLYSDHSTTQTTPSIKHPKYKSETLEKATIALNFISNDLPRNDWLKIATALKSEFGDSAKHNFLSWSGNGKSSDRSNAKSTWRSIQTGKVKINTLYWYARQHGYTEENQKITDAGCIKQQQAQAERKAEQAKQAEREELEKRAEQQRAQTAIKEVLNHLTPATPNATIYLKEKQSDGCGAYILHASDIQKTNTARNTYPFNEIKKGALFIPFQKHDGEYVGAQLIYGSKKRQIKGSVKKDSYAYVGLAPLPNTTNKIYIGEGYSTVNSVLQADVKGFGVMAVDAGNLPLVAKSIRGRCQNANIIILGDNDKSGAGQAKAKEAGQYANNVLIPRWIEGQVKSTDFNDVHVVNGLDALKKELGIYDPLTINKRYLGDSIANALEDHRVLGVLSAFGTGKTTAIVSFINSFEKKHNRKPHLLYITPLKSLCKSTAEKLNLAYYEVVKNESKADATLSAKQLCSTSQSANSATKHLPIDFAYDLIILDESEAIAQAIVSETTEKQADSIQTLKRLIAPCKTVVFMDAGYADDSAKLAEILTGGVIPVLKNKNNPWSKIIATILQGGLFSDRKNAITSKIIDAIRGGEKIGVHSSSATYCEEIYNNLQIRFPCSRGRLCTSKIEYKDIMNDTELVAELDYIVYSPSMSVGVSFDFECFNQVFAVFANEIGTPDSKNAMQAMARFRHLIDNKWTIALDADKEIYTHTDKSLTLSEEIQSAVMRRATDNTSYSESRRQIVVSDLDLVNLFSTVEASKRNNKNNFNHKFINDLKKMGVSICMESIKDMVVDPLIGLDAKEFRKEKKEQAVQAILNAEKIGDEIELERLKAVRHYGKTTEKENKSLERAYIEDIFNVDFDVMSDSQKREILKQKDEGFIKSAIRREKMRASKELSKAFVKSGLDGLDNEKRSGKKDITHNKHNYVLEKKLHAYALPFIDGKEYSHASLKRSGFYQFVMTNKKEINIFMTNFVPSNFKAKPAGLMSKLIANLGYKHESKRDGKGKKRKYIYSSKTNKNFESFLNLRQERGTSWDDFTEKLFMELDSQKELLSKTDIKRLQMPVVDVRYVLDKLQSIPKIKQGEVMAIYKEKYDMLNPENQGMDAPIFANAWLQSQTV